MMVAHPMLQITDLHLTGQCIRPDLHGAFVHCVVGVIIQPDAVEPAISTTKVWPVQN